LCLGPSPCTLPTQQPSLIDFHVHETRRGSNDMRNQDASAPSSDLLHLGLSFLHTTVLLDT
jgi:hypothetical protein